MNGVCTTAEKLADLRLRSGNIMIIYKSVKGQTTSTTSSRCDN